MNKPRFMKNRPVLTREEKSAAAKKRRGRPPGRSPKLVKLKLAEKRLEKEGLKVISDKIDPPEDPKEKKSAGYRKKKLERKVQNDLGVEEEKDIIPPVEVALRDIEKFCVLFDTRRGLNRPQIAARWKLSVYQVKTIQEKYRIEDLKVGAEIREYMGRINAAMLTIQADILESITPDDLKRANLTQKGILLGILADKVKQYDAHTSGTLDTTVNIVTTRSRDELEERIKVLKERNKDILEADFQEVEERNEEVKEEVESPQGDLFPQDAVHRAEVKKEDESGSEADSRKVQKLNGGMKRLGPGVFQKEDSDSVTRRQSGY